MAFPILQSPDTPLTRRVKAAQAVVDLYDSRELVMGEVDCIRPVMDVMFLLGRDFPVEKVGSYRTEIGAQRVVRKNFGVTSLDAAIDTLGLPRIGYASALPADIVALPGEDERWPALAIYLGNNRVLGFGDREGRVVCGVMEPLHVLFAWRVDPCPKP